jgi:hypothetical protein
MSQTGLLPGSVLKRANYIQMTITGPDQVQLRVGDQELI